jgi:hypothetical protein
VWTVVPNPQDYQDVFYWQTWYQFLCTKAEMEARLGCPAAAIEGGGTGKFRDFEDAEEDGMPFEGPGYVLLEGKRHALLELRKDGTTGREIWDVWCEVLPAEEDVLDEDPQAVDEPARRLLGVLEAKLQPLATLETPSAPELQQVRGLPLHACAPLQAGAGRASLVWHWHAPV